MNLDLTIRTLRSAVLTAAVALSGCHTLHRLSHSCNSDSTGYVRAGSVAPLRVPPGIDAPNTRSALQIPALTEPPPPARGANDPCLEEPPPYTEPKVKPAPAA